MLACFKDLLDSNSLSPHGVRLLWRPELISTHVASDFIIRQIMITIVHPMAGAV